MIFRQLFDHETHSFSYLIGCENTKDALIIDPVENQTDLIISYAKELGLHLTKTVETHVHADHVTGAGSLREKIQTESYSAAQANVDCASHTFKNLDTINIGNLTLTALHTPGHTDDSYSFFLEDKNNKYLFTGDTLLIRGTGRTDFQNGSAESLYESLQQLFKYPESTLVYPGHDYRGRNMSSIAEEKTLNPRIINKSKDEFIKTMTALDLPKPKFIDIAVPANQACGKSKTNEIMEANG